MRTIKLFLLLAPAFFACAGLRAQVIIGGLEEPKAGALLDLNSSTTKGGLLLSNVNIDNLNLIPAGNNIFPNIDSDSLDVNWGLRGAIVYNINQATGTGVYIWNGKYWMPATETEQTDEILFTINTTDDVYSIPTSGYLGATWNHNYDWDITVDGQPASAGSNGHCVGTGGSSAGILLTGLSSGDHQIRITPHNAPFPGWGNAFGYLDNGGAFEINREKLISIDAPLSTLAFAPKADGSEDAANASYMFAYLFMSCTNLAHPAVIRDNYRLPETVTNLSCFLRSAYNYISNLEEPIDLTFLKDWLKGNTSISNLSYFLYYTHKENHSLINPIDLAPLSGWFNGNLSITNLSYFLDGTHLNNTSLENPIDLTPLSGWFNATTSVSNLSNFLASIHYGNTSLRLSGQIIFPNWIKTIQEGTTPILDIDALSLMFAINAATPLSGDTGEPKFEDESVLSTLGTPSSNKRTYTYRNDITPINNNWK
jgi:hypothetical protein